jgi:hypothetical protein
MNKMPYKINHRKLSLNGKNLKYGKVYDESEFKEVPRRNIDAMINLGWLEIVPDKKQKSKKEEGD